MVAIDFMQKRIQKIKHLVSELVTIAASVFFINSNWLKSRANYIS